MTALAEPDYFEDYDEDYRSDIASRYEEGFGQGPDIDDDYDSGYDELDKLFDGLFDDDDDDFDAPAKAEKKAPSKKAAPKAAAAKTAAPKKAAAKSMPKASPVITRRVVPVAAPVVEAPVAEATLPEEATVETPTAAEAPLVAAPVIDSPVAEAPVAETPTAHTPVAEAPVAEAPVIEQTASVTVVESAPAEGAEEAEPAVPDSPFFAPHIAPVNEHVDFLRKLRPGFEVPYVDPMHSVEDCRIVTLFSNTSEASPRGTVWAGDDTAATRLLGLQFQLGLRPEWMMPWNTHPWFTPGEANGKLTPEQVSAGLKPLITFLKLVPRASAIVAHGTEANRLAQMLLKTDNPLIWRRGLKVYKARSLHGRAFAGSKERQTEWLIEMGRSYADAMARAGLQAGRR